MRRNGWLQSLALGVLVTAGAMGCGGGGAKEPQSGAPASQPLAHADAVEVTYYYLPG